MLTRLNQLEEQIASLKAVKEKQAEDFRNFKVTYLTEKEIILNPMETITKGFKSSKRPQSRALKSAAAKKSSGPPRPREDEELSFYNLSSDDCGLSMAVDASSIIGAQDSEPGDWPWMAHITLIGEDEDTNSCGGFLISESQIISAAHCFDKLA